MGKFKGTQIGESAMADFEENTWTFEMKEDFQVIAGEFAIVPKEEYLQLLSQRDELLGFAGIISASENTPIAHRKLANELINKIQNG